MIDGRLGGRGHGDDLEAAFVAHADEVRAYIARLARPAAVDDLLQETWARAIRGDHLRDRSRHALPWLIAIARNLCLDARRRATRVDVVALESVTELSLEDDGSGPLEAFERRRLIREVFAEIPARQRRMLVRHELEGVSYAELAAEDGTSVEAVRALIRRGRSAFRQRYATLAKRRGLLGGVVAPLGRRLRSLGTFGNACAGVGVLVPFVAGVALVLGPHAPAPAERSLARIPVTRASAPPVSAALEMDVVVITGAHRSTAPSPSSGAYRTPQVEIAPTEDSKVSADVDFDPKKGPGFGFSRSLQLAGVPAVGETKVGFDCDPRSVTLTTACMVLAHLP